MTENGPVELSVLIATYNRRDVLRRCLDSLTAQTEDPARFEVIVADDGSDDGTAALAEGFEAPFALRVLQLDRGGQAAAQNAAIEAAAGTACLLLDDDVIASPELVAAHLAAHRRDPRTIGVGALTQQPIADDDWFAQAVSQGWAEHYEDLAGRPARWTDCFGANVSLPRQGLLEVGGIATDLDVAFDFDIALRLCQQGCVPRFLPAAHGVHDDKGKDTKVMLRDAARQGAMHVELSRRHPDREAELLDWEKGAGRIELLLRRLAVAARVPPAALASPGRLLPGVGRKMTWLHFVRRIAFWRGVRTSVDGRRWRRLTQTAAAVPTPATASGFPLLIVGLPL